MFAIEPRPRGQGVLAPGLVLALGLAAPAGCAPPTTGREAAARPDTGDRAAEREQMVRRQIEARGVRDSSVLAAMREVPRHRFVLDPHARDAYADHPLPIGHDQTISQPYIVALMSELAAVKSGDRVLEIGTGSGYQAAVLAAMGCRVYSIEIVEPLAREAAERLAELGYDTVYVRAGDGYAGWPDEAPFDAVLLTAAPPEIPGPLLEQLRPGGRLIAPVGEMLQELVVVERTGDGYVRRSVLPVRFVPMTGEAQRRREKPE